MPHYNSYESFKQKRSIEKKDRSKEKTYKLNNDFIIDNNDDYGVVIELKYNDAFVLYHDEVIVAKLRNDLNLICNKVIFPGDKVVLSKNKEKYVITNLIKRSNLLSRIKKDSTRLDDEGITKPIAVNIDVALIVVSCKEPALHPKFIDRYLMILESFNIPSIIVLNKCDLKTEYEENILNIYKDLSINVIETSTLNNTGIDELKENLFGKQAIFVGNSGVGKSSLTNALMDSSDALTSHVGGKTKRGRHTTTSSKYYVWSDSSSIIDTPGIRSLDVSTLSTKEVQQYFKEFDNYSIKCKYSDCTHYNESIDDCFVKQAVNSGLINKDRYDSYIRIISDIKK